jgi:hypothetical protein
MTSSGRGAAAKTARPVEFERLVLGVARNSHDAGQLDIGRQHDRRSERLVGRPADRELRDRRLLALNLHR